MEAATLYTLFSQVRMGKSGTAISIAKPTLLLTALARCNSRLPRLASLIEYEESVRRFEKLSQRLRLEYPFKRLSADRIWEVANSETLLQTASGDYSRQELLRKGVEAGFRIEVYHTLSEDSRLVSEIAHNILLPLFSCDDQLAITKALPVFDSPRKNPTVAWRPHVRIKDGNKMKRLSHTAQLQENHNNPFVSYLNSLHNVGAGGANALAESQVLNRYFFELYEPFPVVADLVAKLRDASDCVVVLTGHAGDGKSTVALDVLKQLRGLPMREPLAAALKEREVITEGMALCKPVTVIKDMSELSASHRLQWLQDAFETPGSYLIVSNTGPLLNSLKDYAKRMQFFGDIENTILEQLNLPYVDGNIDDHKLTCFVKKDLFIVNMTRLDNVTSGARIFSRMLSHSGWSDCTGCSICQACPIYLNRDALSSNHGVSEERVRWIYRRLTAYEQRLTLRQMVAHLAYSLTGGMTCKAARESVAASTSEGMERGTDGLENILFSETFFGYSRGDPAENAEGLRAIDLLRQEVYGGPIGADFSRDLAQGQGSNWASLPQALTALSRRWAVRAKESAGVRWRFAQRRMLYIFGTPNRGTVEVAERFIDGFLHSARLRDYDYWTIQRELALGLSKRERLRDACLKVLLEVYSGFSSGQFRSEHGYLYLTLRRPDRAAVQPTQLVMATLSFRDFELGYDPSRRVPLLCFKPADISMSLTLPLLDYIEGRYNGDLGGSLATIHLAQLEWFRSELLRLNKNQTEPEMIQLLRASIDGEAYLHRFIIDEEHKRLEILT